MSLVTTSELCADDFLFWVAWKRKKGQRMETTQRELARWASENDVFVTGDASVYIVPYKSISAFNTEMRRYQLRYGSVQPTFDRAELLALAAKDKHDFLAGVLSTWESQRRIMEDKRQHCRDSGDCENEDREVGDGECCHGGQAVTLLDVLQSNSSYSQQCFEVADSICRQWSDTVETAKTIRSAVGTALNQKLAVRSRDLLEGLVDLGPNESLDE